MAFKKSTTVFLFVLILAASIPERVDSKKYKNDHVWQKVKPSSGGGPASWFFPGGRSRSTNQEAQNQNQNHNTKSIREQLATMESNHENILIIQLAASSNKVTSLSTHWQNLMNSINVKIETFPLSNDKMIIKVLDQNFVQDVKQFIEDEVNVLTVENLIEFAGRIGENLEKEGQYDHEQEQDREQEQEQEQEYEQNEQEGEQNEYEEKEYKKEKSGKKKGKGYKEKEKEKKKSKKGKKYKK